MTTALVALGSIQPTQGAAAGSDPATPQAQPAVGSSWGSGSAVIVKVDPRLRVRLGRTGLRPEAGGEQLTGLRSLLSSEGVAVSRRFIAPAGELDDVLNSYYRLEAPSPAAALALVARLRATDGVVNAYLAPRPVPVPASPDLTSQQTNSTAPPPHGIGVAAANAFGITGAGVSMFDLEYSWNQDHEDLTDLLAPGAMIANGTPFDPFNNASHGTAVIGELDANPNGFGVTGLSAGVSLHTVNVDNVERGYDLGNAIALAAARGNAGDVILIEQQQLDNNNNYVPVEYYSEYYDAIRAATAKGLIVIEPAGNGGHSLDEPAYGNTFPFDRADSGAILVGAGAPANCVNSGGTPEHAAMPLTDYGERVDVQGLGACVTTTGYGYAYGNGIDANSDYTATFGGTSSASPIVASSAALLVQWGRQNTIGGTAPNYTLKPQELRRLLVATGTPQAAGDTRHIGPLPDIANAFGRLLPSIGAVPNQTVASGTTFTIKAPNAAPSVLGGPLTYSWSQTGGPAATITSPTSQSTGVSGVTGPASLTFRVRVSDPRRQASTAATTVTVAGPTTLVADAGQDFPVVSGNAATTIPLTSSGSGPGGLTYQWMLLGSTDGKGGSIKNPTAATTSTNSFTPNGNQSYTYRLTVSSGGRSASDDVVVSVRPK